MLKIAINVLENLLATADVADKNKMIDKGVSDQKLKKLKKLAKSKNLINLFKSQKISAIKIKVTEFLISKVKIVFT